MQLSALRLATLIVIVSFSSCRKSDNHPKPVCRIITVARDADPPIVITYNADGKIASSSTGNGKWTFQYSNDTVIINQTESGVFKSKSFVTLNEHDLATNVRRTYEPGTGWLNQAFEYNGKELVKETVTTSSGQTPQVTTYTWADGNVITSDDGTGRLKAFVYYNDKPSQAGDYVQFWQLFYGYSTIVSRNAIKSFISSGSTMNFSYTTDSDGKFTSLTIGDPPNATTYTYTYQCN